MSYTPVTLLICPLRSKASDAQTEESKIMSKAEDLLRRVHVKEAYHYALGVRDEVFELTRCDKKYFIKRTSLEEWKKDKEERVKGETPGWEDRGECGCTKLSNDNIFYIAEKFLWVYWEKKYCVFLRDCQHFVKLLYKSICQIRIPSKSDSFANLFRFGRGNIKDLFRKGEGFPLRWNRLFTKYPMWSLVVVGGSLAIVGIAPHATAIIAIVSFSFMIANLAYRGTRWITQRPLRHQLAAVVEALLKMQDAQAKCDEDEDEDACSLDLLLAQ